MLFPTSNARAPVARARSTPASRHHLCACGAPLLARYDLDALTGWRKESLRDRVSSLWRYQELLPLFPANRR